MAKKNQTKNRTIYYFRNQFSKLSNYNVRLSLEELVEQAWDKLNTTEERSFYFGDEKFVLGMKKSSRRVSLKSGNDSCTVLSLGLYEQGAKANTITKPSKSAKELEADIYDAPENGEYLDGEAFVCIFGNHLLSSPSAMLKESHIHKFFEELLFSGGFTEESNLLDIQQIANIDTLKTIETEGVKSITINAATYLATMKHMKRVNKSTKTGKMLHKITNLVSSTLDLLRDDETDEEMVEKEGLNTRVVLTHDGRGLGVNSEDGQNKAVKTAKLLASSTAGGYTILTKKGTKFTNDDTILKQVVKVNRHGKSVVLEEIWQKLVTTLEFHEKNGLLEQ